MVYSILRFILFLFNLTIDFRATKNIFKLLEALWEGREEMIADWPPNLAEGKMTHEGLSKIPDYMPKQKKTVSGSQSVDQGGMRANISTCSVSIYNQSILYYLAVFSSSRTTGIGHVNVPLFIKYLSGFKW